MHELEPGAPYRDRTPRQHQWFLQLEMACDIDEWASRWLRAPRVPPLLAAVRTPEGEHHVLAVTPRFVRGVRKVIFARLIDLAGEDHGREAMEIVAGWRAPLPNTPDAPDRSDRQP